MASAVFTASMRLDYTFVVYVSSGVHGRRMVPSALVWEGEGTPNLVFLVTAYYRRMFDSCGQTTIR